MKQNSFYNDLAFTQQCFINFLNDFKEMLENSSHVVVTILFRNENVLLALYLGIADRARLNQIYL